MPISPRLTSSAKQRIKFEKTSIFIRRGPTTELANYEELQELINKKIETDYSTRSEIEIDEHLEQLKLLYNQIEPIFVSYKNSFTDLQKSILKLSVGSVKDIKPNPKYPKEDYEDFIVNIINLKKKKIKKLFDL